MTKTIQIGLFYIREEVSRDAAVDSYAKIVVIKTDDSTVIMGTNDFIKGSVPKVLLRFFSRCCLPIYYSKSIHSLIW